ncbi:MAG: alpha/beta hydrolase [Chloroflexi bacterium]|nr:alpha/beta hydrolase [Chloroflexota bacterium]
MERTVNFHSSGLKLEGVLFLPEGTAPAERRPGIVVCHGFTQHKEIFGLSYAAALARHGFAALSFDYRGFGGSEGQRGRLIPLHEVEDARNALTFLETVPEVDAHRLGLLGTSFGGAVVLHIGAFDSRPRAIVSFDGIGSGRRWLRSQRRGYEWAEFLERLERDRRQRVLTGESEYVDYGEISIHTPQAAAAVEDRKLQYPTYQYMLPLETGETVIEFNPEEFAPRIAPRALLVIYDPNPRGFATEEAHAIYNAASEPKKLVEIPQGPHQYSHYFGEALEHWIGLAADWYRAYL